MGQGKEKKNAEPSVFRQEILRDINTFKRLDGRRRLQFVFDYYKWKILGFLTALICVIMAVNLLWQGQKPCRLRVCAVLNTNESCAEWFDAFYRELSSDGNTDPVELDEDQPFDYDNMYYYVQEAEVMAKVSSQRMDAAVCGPDMYSYLLSVGACADLDTLDFDTALAVYSTAGIKYDRAGHEDRSGAKDGFYALDISGTAFGLKYNTTQDPDQAPEPLYFVIISNTRHLPDCLKLAEAISRS